MPFRISPAPRAGVLALPAYALALTAVALSGSPVAHVEPLSPAAPPSASHLTSRAEPGLEPQPVEFDAQPSTAAASEPALPPTTSFPAIPSVAQLANHSQLTHDEVQAVLLAAGWPEHLLAAASTVVWCESKWSPGALGDGGRGVGLFQLNLNTWFPHAGVDTSL